LHRKNRPRTSGRAEEEKRHEHGNPLPRTDVSISRAGSDCRIRPPRQTRRHHLGTRRAGKYGSPFQHAPAPETHSRRPPSSERETKRRPQPSHGQLESSRSRAKDAPDASLHNQVSTSLHHNGCPISRASCAREVGTWTFSPEQFRKSV